MLCGEVCPTGAIWEITQAEKAWLPASAAKDAKPIRLGTAFYNRGRCLPWAMATECIVCEEWCPTSPKAIYLRPVEVTDSLGNVKQIRQPYVDPEPLRRVRSVRVRLPGQRPAGRLRHQHRREPLEDQPDFVEAGYRRIIREECKAMNETRN